MWLMGCPNPCKLEQKLECTFLKPFIQVKIKWASKEFSIYAIQSYQLHSKADSAHQGWIGLTAWLVTLNGIGEKFFWCSSWFYMGKRFQKNALPFLFQFARVRAAHQLLVPTTLNEDPNLNSWFSPSSHTFINLSKKIIALKVTSLWGDMWNPVWLLELAQITQKNTRIFLYLILVSVCFGDYKAKGNTL